MILANQVNASRDENVAVTGQGAALYFCRTPLQSLIVQELIRHKKEAATVIYFPTSASVKHKFYFDRLAGAEKFFLPWQPLGFSDTLTDALAWWRIPRPIRRRHYTELYISSIGSIPFGMLVARNPAAGVNTFDDGTFNINPEVFPHWIEHEPNTRKWVKCLLNSVNNRQLIGRGKRHFTIFKAADVLGIPYLLEELKLIEAARIPPALGHAMPPKKVRVLLGTRFIQPDHRQFCEDLIDSSRFDVFLPHPAENATAFVKPWVRAAAPSLDVENMIAEDAVLALLRSGMTPTVYGFNSTALLTLARLVRTCSLKLPGHSAALPDDLLRKMGVRPLRTTGLGHVERIRLTMRHPVDGQ